LIRSPSVLLVGDGKASGLSKTCSVATNLANCKKTGPGLGVLRPFGQTGSHKFGDTAFGKAIFQLLLGIFLPRADSGAVSKFNVPAIHLLISALCMHVCVLLWSPYIIRQTIIFSCCGLFFLLLLLLLFFLFPHLISAVADWMSAILPHMVWP